MERNVPTYEQGDYIKVEFPDEATGVSEWMWGLVHHCDDEQERLAHLGFLDNAPAQQLRQQTEAGVPNWPSALTRFVTNKKTWEFDRTELSFTPLLVARKITVP